MIWTVVIKHRNDGPQEKEWVLFPRDPQGQEETKLTVSFGASHQVFCYIPPSTSKLEKKQQQNKMLDADGHTNFPPFQGARPDHVRVESLSSCFPGKLVSLWFFDLESVFQTKQATSCAHLETTVYSLLATGSRNPESSPRVVYSTNSIASTTAIIRPSPATSTAIATKTQSVSNPSRVPGNGRQDASCMETNRLSTLEMVLMAVCGGLTAVVIGLAARLCILRKRRRTRFVSFFFQLLF